MWSGLCNCVRILISEIEGVVIYRPFAAGVSKLKIPKWPSLGPWYYGVLLYSSLNFWKIIRGFVWKMLLESKALLSNNFFKKIQTHRISFLNDGGLKLGDFDIFDMLLPFLKFTELWPINYCMKSRSHDGLAAKGLLEILKVCRILIMLMVGRQCNIQNKRASES